METKQNKYDAFSPNWQARFAFYDKYGSPGTKEFKTAIKDLSFSKKFLFTGNWIAFFFGFIYLFVLGLWKKNLSLAGMMILTGFILGIIEIMIGKDLPRGMDMGIGIAFGILYMQVANYGYYLKVTQNKQSWNPFEGLKMF